MKEQLSKIRQLTGSGIRFKKGGIKIKLYQFQEDGIKAAEGKNRIAYYWEMGTGKTFVGAETLHRWNANINLIVCQKSKVNDWLEHFKRYYPLIYVYNLTDKKSFETFEADLKSGYYSPMVGIINYDLVFRRKELMQLENFTLLLDESSLIQNSKAKRTKFILKMNPANVILLSGTPVGGKYENLWTQLHLLGWDISERMYLSQFVRYRYLDTRVRSIPIVCGYKNVERLKRKMREYGCQFLKTECVFELPEQVFQTISIPATKEYRRFQKHSIVTVNGEELIGDTALTKMLHERQLCGILNADKIAAFADILDSTNERIVCFYNFVDEFEALKTVCERVQRPYSAVNGAVKDLTVYDAENASVTLVQYQSGAMGLNLQKANRIVYFSPPLSSELYEQSKKRIHRIGQNRTCFYICLTVRDSIEEKIYKTLETRNNYTLKLFEEGN